ncbi:MAG: imidazole glycerol phosphate synthase subunit HisH [Oscillospiraceae bacterium]|nr:imidazole glycerol phosphate synthase subunit HisH [Oscillospiraceae bacterium]
MISIIDYGAGNIFSVKNALDYLGFDNKLTKDKAEIENSDAIILPGVGAFPSAMNMLNETGLTDTIKAQAKVKPFLGICLGMQMLFDKSYEFEECDGLGLINGKVDNVIAEGMNIPHMGWNKLEKLNDCPLLDNLNDDEYVYFVHSYQAYCDDKNIAAYCEYANRIPALVFDGNNVYGAQFHPEKSGETGLKILRNFGGLIR